MATRGDILRITFVILQSSLRRSCFLLNVQQVLKETQRNPNESPSPSIYIHTGGRDMNLLYVRGLDLFLYFEKAEWLNSLCTVAETIGAVAHTTVRDISHGKGQSGYTRINFLRRLAAVTSLFARELKQQRRRRLRKRYIKSEFAPLQTLSRLFISFNSSNLGNFFWS